MEISIKYFANSMGDKVRKTKKIAEFYDLDKPTYYIFKNITFDSPLKITFFYDNAHIIFKHCTFKGNVIIELANDIKFVSNKYEDNDYYSGEERIFVRINHCNNLQIYNENFTNTKEEHHPTNFGIKVNGAEMVEIVDTNINIDNTVKYKGEVKVKNRREISISTQNLYIENSTLESPEIYIDADNLNYNDNKVRASNGIIIENKNNDLVGIATNITTPYLVYNGLEVTEISEKAIDNSKEKSDLKNSRENLISTLRTIENKVIKTNEEILSQEIEKQNTKALKRILKRKIN